MQIQDIEYTLVRKNVKNVNMRITRDGEVRVSANNRVPLAQIEAFVLAKQKWILRAKSALAASENDEDEILYTKEQALELFMPYINVVFPLFADILGGNMPIIKVRLMKTRWGVCNFTRKIITLNLSLVTKPTDALLYVIMHEFVHFIVPDHSPRFYTVLRRYMPDYERCKALLKK